MEIQEIVEHLAIADGTDAHADAHRWEAARGIWEHRTLGKSLRQVGDEIGRSHMYVQYMQRCWGLIGRDIWEAATDKDNVTYPDFKGVYYSAEVRGESSKEGRGRRQATEDEEGDEDVYRGKDRMEMDDDSADLTAHGLVTSAAGAIGSLYRRRGEWAMLSTDDRATLRCIANQIATIGTS